MVEKAPAAMGPTRVKPNFVKASAAGLRRAVTVVDRTTRARELSVGARSFVSRNLPDLRSVEAARPAERLSDTGARHALIAAARAPNVVATRLTPDA